MWKVLVVICTLGNPCTMFVEEPTKYYPTEEECMIQAREKSKAMTDTLVEYTEVLHELPNERPRIFYMKEIVNLLDEIGSYGTIVHPTLNLTGDPAACSHEPDKRFLECAVAAEADYLITVNIRHFPQSFRGVQSVLPSTF